MKVKTKLLMKITSIAIVAIMLMLSFASAVFAGAVAPSYDRGNSLADALKLDEDQAVDVIVEFTSPSLLELNVPANSPEAALYEQKLTREQNEVLGKLDIIPHYSYTGVINAVAITATVGEIRALERMRGVEDVYLSDTFNSPKTDQYQQNSASSPDIIGISSAVPSGYTGDGVLVAVLDSGITFEHEAFNNTKYVQNPALTREDLAALGFDADTSYYNQKIPFYRDYTGSTTEQFDSESGHGSHVAGIIGGYAENEDGTVKF